jgi:uncharacterized protein involved in exopolysaccharide biosynthesis
MSVSEAKKKESVDEDEIGIRLSDIIKLLRHGRKTILWGAMIGLIIGAIYAFSKPNVYTAQISVMPEIQSKGTSGLSSLGSLVGLAGLGLDNMTSSDAVRPDLYPNILQSIPFALDLLKQPVYSQKLQKRLPLRDFMAHLNTSKFSVFSLFSGEEDPKGESNSTPISQAIQLTQKQASMVKAVQSSVSAIYDRKTGILTLSAVEPDPVVAAAVVSLSLEYLTNYVTTYRTEKASKQVSFLTQRVNEVKGRYQAAEYKLSSYKDRNQNLYLNTAKIDEQRLQADYLLEQSVYNELSKQLEQAKIKVQEETPVFKILEPATVPLRKSGPGRTLIMIGFLLVGSIIGLIGTVYQRRSQIFRNI